MLSFSETFQSKSRTITRRMFILSSLKITIFIAIIVRLFYLQISENIKWRTLSDKNRLREWKTIPQRGIIEDYFGNKIAKNTQVFQLHMLPEDVPNIEELFFRLSKIIDFNKKTQTSLIRRMKKRKPWEPIIISDNLSWKEFSRLNLFLHEMQGIKPVVAVARQYLDEGSSSHIIGYVSEMSVKDLESSELLRSINAPGLKTGKNGLEKYLNEEMIGQPGLQRFEVNAYGKRIKELKLIQGVPGKNYRTTLDIEVQKFASELLKDKSGSICVMDIYTGDIIAMVSSPTYDANKFVHGISSKDWQNLINDDKKPLINKSISGTYPPGSTIKPLVALSALENDVISPKTTVECRGSIELYGHKYHCWKEKGHGFMRLREAIKQSCDIYFYEAARRLGIDRLAITANKFGLGNKVLDFLIEEKKGLVPTTKWKLRNIGKGWVLGETLLAGIGQGYFQATPIQLCLMSAQLANGGHKIEPKIIYNEKTSQFTSGIMRNQFEKLYRNKENVKFVLDAQFGANNEPMGTSYRSRHIKSEYIYAGKTGTSQIRSITAEERRLKIKQKDLPYKRRDHALFIAFAPYKNPKYAISIVIEHGGTGSSSAAPIAKKIIKKVLDRHQLRKKYHTNLLWDI
ncbi:MAG: penicillin-binding protein 2 [Candidatus Pelagibacterales bacterium]|nr:MAG: penicillin-binding protein 2 [Pelagibacterales bacterium]